MAGEQAMAAETEWCEWCSSSNPLEFIWSDLWELHFEDFQALQSGSTNSLFYGGLLVLRGVCVSQQVSDASECNLAISW